MHADDGFPLAGGFGLGDVDQAKLLRVFELDRAHGIRSVLGITGK
jgi:hypothetical protein